MKKQYFLLAFNFVTVTLIFSYFLFTDPIKILRHFSFLSPDGTFSNPTLSLIKLYIPIASLALIITSLLIKKIRERLIFFFKENKRFLSATILFLILYFSTLIFSKNTLFPIFFKEDGVFEYLTALFFLLSSIIFGVFLFQIFNTKHKPTILLFFFLAIFAFFVGMEEISWGQRIFGWSTPENFKQINYQNETTLHNLFYQYEIFITIYLIASVAFIAFFASANLPEKYVFKIDKSYLPNKKMYYPTLFLPFLAFVDQELFEVTISAILFVYALKIFHLLRAKNIPVNRESRAII